LFGARNYGAITGAMAAPALIAKAAAPMVAAAVLAGAAGPRTLALLLFGCSLVSLLLYLSAVRTLRNLGAAGGDSAPQREAA